MYTNDRENDRNMGEKLLYNFTEFRNVKRLWRKIIKEEKYINNDQQ